MDCSCHYPLSHGVSGKILKWVAIPLLRWVSSPGIELSLLHCRRILCCLTVSEGLCYSPIFWVHNTVSSIFQSIRDLMILCVCVCVWLCYFGHLSLFSKWHFKTWNILKCNWQCLKSLNPETVGPLPAFQSSLIQLQLRCEGSKRHAVKTNCQVAKTPDFLALMALTCCPGQGPSLRYIFPRWNTTSMGTPGLVSPEDSSLGMRRGATIDRPGWSGIFLLVLGGPCCAKRSWKEEGVRNGCFSAFLHSMQKCKHSEDSKL